LAKKKQLTGRRQAGGRHHLLFLLTPGKKAAKVEKMHLAQKRENTVKKGESMEDLISSMREPPLLEGGWRSIFFVDREKPDEGRLDRGKIKIRSTLQVLENKRMRLRKGNAGLKMVIHLYPAGRGVWFWTD